jgi:hypothetical protein
MEQPDTSRDPAAAPQAGSALGERGSTAGADDMELIQVSADPRCFVVRIADLDQPVRRIFPMPRLLDAVRAREMGLVAPQLWEDPREDQPALCMLDGTGHVEGKGQRPLSAYLAPAWAQCWSLNPGSDTLLRAYSRVRLDEKSRLNTDPENEGVTVTTTVRKLLAAATAWHADGADGHVVIGRVEYLPDKEIGQRIVNACNGKYGPGFFCSVQGRADSLMWKRDFFEHEREVRILLIDRSWKRENPAPKVRPVRIDPNELFTSISFDPRLQDGEANDRAAVFRDAGYTGEIVRDPSYQKQLYLLAMTRDWPDP